MNILKKRNSNIRLLSILFVIVILAFPLSAQEKGDSIFTFRFYFGKDMFYAPGLNNGEQLTRLFEAVDQHKEKIKNREISLRVDGYYVPDGKQRETQQKAKIRSNRVKSELITRKGLKEDNFITRNQTGDGRYVLVRFFDNIKNEYLTSGDSSDTKVEMEETVEEQPSVKDCDTLPPPHEEIIRETDVIETEEYQPAISNNSLSKEKSDSRFALKTNMLFYLVLMPNVELEWKFADRWSAALEFQGAWYAKEEPHKVYRLSTLTPEVRYWVIEHSRWHGMYVGLFAGAGPFDLCDAHRGHEGEGIMGGISGGYMWPISKHLSLDAGLGVGYMRARDKEYLPKDGHYIYQLTRKINYVGPLRLKLSLVWRIPY